MRTSLFLAGFLATLSVIATPVAPTPTHLNTVETQHLKQDLEVPDFGSGGSLMAEPHLTTDEHPWMRSKEEPPKKPTRSRPKPKKKKGKKIRHTYKIVYPDPGWHYPIHNPLMPHKHKPHKKKKKANKPPAPPKPWPTRYPSFEEWMNNPDAPPH
ncbi:hypothetical protein SGCOL_010144 [Colletotrichum sp. CLE4]